MKIKREIGLWMIRAGHKIARVGPAPIVRWEHYRFDRCAVHLNGLSRGTMAEFAIICFHHNSSVERLVFAFCLGRLIVHSLGDRFTSEQIGKIMDYKPAGISLEFEEAGEIYAKGRYREVDGILHGFGEMVSA